MGAHNVYVKNSWLFIRGKRIVRVVKFMEHCPKKGEEWIRTFVITKTNGEKVKDIIVIKKSEVRKRVLKRYPLSEIALQRVLQKIDKIDADYDEINIGGGHHWKKGLLEDQIL